MYVHEGEAGQCLAVRSSLLSVLSQIPVSRVQLWQGSRGKVGDGLQGTQASLRVLPCGSLDCLGPLALLFPSHLLNM